MVSSQGTRVTEFSIMSQKEALMGRVSAKPKPEINKLKTITDVPKSNNISMKNV